MVLILNMWVSYLPDESIFMTLVFILCGMFMYGMVWYDVLG